MAKRMQGRLPRQKGIKVKSRVVGAAKTAQRSYERQYKSARKGGRK